jgi:hypothetical protein
MRTTQQQQMRTGSKRFTIMYRVEADFDVAGKNVHATFEVEAGSSDEATAIIADIIDQGAEVQS